MCEGSQLQPRPLAPGTWGMLHSVLPYRNVTVTRQRRESYLYAKSRHFLRLRLRPQQEESDSDFY